MEILLPQMWEWLNPEGHDCLTGPGFFVFCKLLALSHTSKELLTESSLDPKVKQFFFYVGGNMINHSPAPNFIAATAPGAEVAEAPRGTPAPR